MEAEEVLSKDQWDLMLRHLDAIIQKNQVVNLTRIDTVEDGVLLHIQDSLSALPEMEKAPAGPYGDLGSGGGYPGIPLAIATGRETMLIDARQKKMAALDEVIGELGLEDQVSTFGGRAELLAHKKPGYFAVLTARALAKLPVLMELASPLLKDRGQLICYKANVEDSELADAKRVESATAMRLVSDRSFDLDGHNRRILVFEKKGNPSMKLPRAEGAAQKHPL